MWQVAQVGAAASRVAVMVSPIALAVEPALAQTVTEPVGVPVDGPAYVIDGRVPFHVGDDPAWESIHMVPEDSVRAHGDLGATTLFPIHWGTFQLSYHPWDAPIRRAVAAASRSARRYSSNSAGS